MKRSVFSLAAIILLFTTDIDFAIAQVYEPDSLALVELYNKTGGDTWTDNSGWLGNMGAWYGVNLTLVNGVIRVTRLKLSFNNLEGTIPPEIGNLTELTHLELFANRLSGPIPSSIGNLTKLKVLMLNGCGRLSGAIPSSIGNLTELLTLDLSANDLSGSIPLSIGNLTNLQWLLLNENELTGEIPSELGNLEYLTQLDISRNQLTGRIPNNLSSMEELEIFRAYDNKLSGEFSVEPFEFMFFLKELDLSKNNFEGQLPRSIGDLSTDLSILNLGDNNFEGFLPVQISKLVNLTQLHLYSNNLEIIEQRVVIPPTGEKRFLPNLKQFTLSNNQLKKFRIETNIYPPLDFLSLSHNQLTFSDLIPVAVSYHNYVEYNPQDRIGAFDFVRSAVLNDFIYLEVKANDIETTLIHGAPDMNWLDPLHEDNQYQWYKDGIEMPGKTDKKMFFYFDPSDSGIYHAKITNPVLPDLTLYTRTVQLEHVDPFEDFFSRIVVIDVKGMVDLKRNNKWGKLRKGTVLQEGDLILTSMESHVNLGFKSGSTVHLAELSELYVTEDDIVRPNAINMQLEIKAREVDAAVVEKAAVKSDFKVRTPTATCSVRGTCFGVYVDSVTNATTVSVSRGTVHVVPEYNPADSTLVTDWQQVTITDSSVGSIGTFTPVTAEIVPDTVQLHANMKFAFTFRGKDANGFNSGLFGKWTAEIGTIDSKGLFKAGTQSGFYTITATDTINNLSSSAVVEVIGWPVGKQEITLEGYALEQNYPNPFKVSSTISFIIPSNEMVVIKVFNLLGEEVKTVLSEPLAKGEHFVQISAKELESGIYFYRIKAGEFVNSKRMIVLK